MNLIPLTPAECRVLQERLRDLLDTEDIDISVEDQCVVVPTHVMKQLVRRLDNISFGSAW